MKAIKVEYTVKEDFVQTNKANIWKVMEDLKSLNANNVLYSSWMKDDGKSFVHIFVSADDAVNPLSDLESFKNFQAELKENVEVPPQATELSPVGASYSLD